jgi:hypothetical protein
MPTNLNMINRIYYGIVIQQNMMASNGKPNQKMNKKNVMYRRQDQLFSSLKLTIYLNTNTEIQFDLMLEDIIIWCQGKRKKLCLSKATTKGFPEFPSQLSQVLERPHMGLRMM